MRTQFLVAPRIGRDAQRRDRAALSDPRRTSDPA
jgi:hypothetical protein